MSDQPKVELLTAESCGWQRIGERTWERPDGQIIIYPPGRPEMVLVVVDELLRLPNPPVSEWIKHWGEP